MHSTLTESLNLLLPNLEPTLASPDAVLSLKALAANLAPILRGGFECRLSANAPQVDFQQCVIRDKSEVALLRELISTTTSGHRGWLQLDDFLAQWSEPLSLLGDSIPEIWLEFDINNSGVSLPIPAIFFGLTKSVSSSVETYPIATKSLDLLLGRSSWCEWQDNLYRCFAACPDGVLISHIGVMLSRKLPALRVNIKRLQPQSLLPYLLEIGWEHETNDLVALMKQLSAKVDGITVCLDVGNKIYPSIGLECIFLNQPDDESRWATFLDYLVELRLCEAQKRDALLKWPGQTNPFNASASWPNNLIVDYLLQSRQRFTVFERRLSHIKISRRKQSPLCAKAYLWFQHQWLSGKN